MLKYQLVNLIFFLILLSCLKNCSCLTIVLEDIKVLNEFEKNPIVMVQLDVGTMCFPYKAEGSDILIVGSSEVCKYFN